MPLVAGKHYPYTSAGYAAAERASRSSGMPMKMKGRARAGALRRRSGGNAGQPAMHGNGHVSGSHGAMPMRATVAD